MKQRIEQFLYGRYGQDSFNRCLLCFAAIILFCTLLAGDGVLYWFGIALMGYAMYRAFSRNHSRRAQENFVYVQISQAAKAGLNSWFLRITGNIKAAQTRFAQRKVYKYFRCPRCHQHLRVPRGRGKIEVCCPKCGTSFLGKS